jgi:hypothetical protein
MSTQAAVRHTIHVRIRERKKRFLVVSVPALHLEPGEEVVWQAVHGQGPFEIKFDKEDGNGSPFGTNEPIETGGTPVTVGQGTAGKCFAYSIYLKSDAKVCLDPSLIVEKP